VTPGCSEIEELAPELALGLLAGGERARALGHLASCPACRATVEELVRVAEALLLLGPEAEPPVGFEARVLDRLEREGRPPQPARPRWRRALVPVAAAAAVAAALFTGVVVGRSTERDPRLERQYIAALRTLGGTSLRAARLHDPGGRDVGEVFVYRGHPSWVFIDVADPAAPSGGYRLELQGRDGAPVASDGFAMRNGSGYLGWPVRAEMDRVGSVVVRDAQGVGRYNAQLPGLS
jgi:hypothetical protein